MIKKILSIWVFLVSTAMCSIASAESIVAVNNVPEKLSAKPFIAAAYGAIWLIVLVFVAITYYRSRKVEEDLKILQQKMQARQGA